MNSAAMNTGVHVSFRIRVFSRYVPGEKKKHKKAQGDVLSLLKETLMTNYYGKILQVGKGSSLG